MLPANVIVEVMAAVEETGAPADRRPVEPGAAHIAFYVDDLEATMRRIEDLGAVRLGEVTRGPTEHGREQLGVAFADGFELGQSA